MSKAFRARAAGSSSAAALEPGSLVLVDSSALVYLVEGEAASPRRAAVERFFGEASAKGLLLVASTLAWAELLEAPLARGDLGLADRYRILLSDSSRIRLEVVDAAVADRAASLAAGLPEPRRRALSPADLMHIATAIVLRASAVLTNDEAWASVPGCPPLLLVDELAAESEA
jgi:predicted nucleic acid-binding protein